ncbi:MAG: ABC transporter ATP-binding protein/permease [Rikenellaceae bacterium]|nr:ABC transporter ATP-binding protein/permease [Rikenellaceae bacterium]
MKTYLRLLGFAKPIEKYAIPYFFFILIYAVFNTVVFVMLIPLLETLFNSSGMIEVVTRPPVFEFSMDYVQKLVNYWLYQLYGSEYDMMGILMLLSALIVASALLSNTFRYLAQRTMEGFRIHTLKRMRNTVFSNVMRLHTGFFSNEKKGDIISKITSDVQVVQFCITNTLQVAFREPFLIAGYLFALLKISIELTLFTVVVLPVSALVIGFIVKTLRKSAKEAQESFGDMVSLIDEALGGIKILKGYNAVDYIIRKFFNENDRYSRISKSMANRQQLASPASEFMGIAAVAVLLIYGGGMVMGGKINASEFITYLAIFSQITRPARQLADSFSTINQGIAAGERVLSLVDTKSEIVNKDNALMLDQFRENIEFHNVSFAYESKGVIHNISFVIHKGETVALVGPSGGGKSTISDLILRFYDVSEGEILIDGVNIKDYNIESVRSHMGIVSQDTVLFNDTIENNIRLGNTEATTAQVMNAAKIANAHEFILDTKDGYQTNTGDRGMKLSGGQRQRISIARAVLKNPDILILDEATSALDTESEKLVQDALNNLLKGRTSLVIAHRLSTILHADKIMVIEDGSIVESGTHNELLALEGVYKKLIDMQHIGSHKND